MIGSTIFLLAAMAGAPAGVEDAADGGRMPIRCRPAPFYITDRPVARPKPERLTITGSRVPAPPERRARPCLLMRAPTSAPPGAMRTAD